uniref:Uncharacterized protein n=1 Tax=Trichogramma kaykai TaxID=54128 RepID=A0ABD2WJP6_9HYME
MFTRNPSPRQSSRASLEYLLLPPRSAPTAAPGRLTPRPFCAHRRDPPTRQGFMTRSAERIEPHLPLTAEYRRDASAPSIFRASCFGSASSAYQNWPTWHSDPFINESLASQFKQARDLTHLKFENRLRSFRPQGL